MFESLRGAHEPSSLAHYHDKTRKAARWHGAAAVAHSLDLAAQPEWFLWTSPGLPRAGSAPNRAVTSHIAPLTALRRIAAIIRMCRRRARSREQLCELNDHLLKDIGLSREAACYEAAKPFWL